MRYLLTRIHRSILMGTIALVGSAGLLIACQSLPQSAHQVQGERGSPEGSLSSQDIDKLARKKVTIASVLSSNAREPGSFNRETIVLFGTITQIAPLLTGVAYELTDETGQIWVVSAETNLDFSDTLDNDSFWVTGTPQYQAIPAGGQDWGETYLQEQFRFPGNN
ncbi:MAG: hypothetical protein ACO3NK_17980 [Prochlorotrichaceae cyanobacterium]|jgi:hypothetical protein